MQLDQALPWVDAGGWPQPIQAFVFQDLPALIVQEPVVRIAEQDAEADVGAAVVAEPMLNVMSFGEGRGLVQRITFSTEDLLRTT